MKRFQLISLFVMVLLGVLLITTSGDTAAAPADGAEHISLVASSSASATISYCVWKMPIDFFQPTNEGSCQGSVTGGTARWKLNGTTIGYGNFKNIFGCSAIGDVIRLESVSGGQVVAYDTWPCGAL